MPHVWRFWRWRRQRVPAATSRPQTYALRQEAPEALDEAAEKARAALEVDPAPPEASVRELITHAHKHGVLIERPKGSR